MKQAATNPLKSPSLARFVSKFNRGATHTQTNSLAIIPIMVLLGAVLNICRRPERNLHLCADGGRKIDRRRTRCQCWLMSVVGSETLMQAIDTIGAARRRGTVELVSGELVAVVELVFSFGDECGRHR
jgi:hypothetical protein